MSLLHLRLPAALLALQLGLGLTAPTRAATFAPLNLPPTTEHRPGKFVWADLFTTDPASASSFYTSLFGWTTTTITENHQVYVVFSNNGHAVAGLVPRSPGAAKKPSRWIGYLAVTDLAPALEIVVKNGGIVRAPAQDFPARGTQAIITDPEGSVIGLIQSSSGDPADIEPMAGDWHWLELFVKQPKAATDFYHQVFAFDVASDVRLDRKTDFFLSSGGLKRAGVAPLPDDLTDAKPGWLGVVRVVGLDAMLDHAVRLGGEILTPAHETVEDSRFAIISDPTGGTIGLVEYGAIVTAPPTAPKSINATQP